MSLPTKDGAIPASPDARAVAAATTDRFKHMQAYDASVADQARSPLPRQDKLGRGDVAVLSLVSVALGICCFVTSARRYLWYDEVNSANLVADPSFNHMIGTVAAGGESAPPLYHTLLWLWGRVAGQSELALRAPSCAGLIIAVIIVWAMLRRRYSLQSTALGVLLSFPMSRLVLHHVAEARFYGLLTALVALAAYLYQRAVESERLSWRLLAAVCATHAALVYTHIYGAFYSAVILAAWIVADRAAGRWRPRGYAAVVVAWLTFLPWVPFLRNAADLARPRGWLTTPTLSALINVYGFAIQRLPVLIIALVTVTALSGANTAKQEVGTSAGGRSSAARRAIGAASVAAASAILGIVPFRLTHPGAPLGVMLRQASGLLVLAIVIAVLTAAVARSSGLRGAIRQEPLLVVATSLLCVPLIAFALSRIVMPIFYDRYLLPSIIGVSIFLAQASEWATRALGSAARASGSTSRARGMPLVWSCVVGALAAYPLWAAYTAPREERPGVRLEQLAAPHSVVVVPRILDFMPMVHYQRRMDLEYVFPMDPETYMDPRAPQAAIYGYRFMNLLAQRGVLAASPEDASSPLCSFSGLVVAHLTDNSWFSLKIASDSGFAIDSLVQPGATADSVVAFVVHARAPLAQRPCLRGVERRVSGVEKPTIS